MAVIQISKIQVRSGLQQDLPQLDTGEFGWSIDTRQLYIGNGTTAEGAPTPGITEILTEFSQGLLSTNISDLQSNVANLQANVTSINSLISGLGISSVRLADATSSVTTLPNTVISLTSLKSNTIDYTITRGSTARVGTIKATQYLGTTVWEDDYSETANTGVILSFLTTGNVANLAFVTTSTGSDATFEYYLKAFA
jgi:hypothetical protein